MGVTFSYRCLGAVELPSCTRPVRHWRKGGSESCKAEGRLDIAAAAAAGKAGSELHLRSVGAVACNAKHPWTHPSRLACIQAAAGDLFSAALIQYKARPCIRHRGPCFLTFEVDIVRYIHSSSWRQPGDLAGGLKGAAEAILVGHLHDRSTQTLASGVGQTSQLVVE